MIPSLISMCSSKLTVEERVLLTARSHNSLNIIPLVKEKLHLTSLNTKMIEEASFSKKVVVLGNQDLSLLNIDQTDCCCIVFCCPCYILNYLMGSPQSEKTTIKMCWRALKESDILETLDFHLSPLKKSIHPLIGFSKLSKLNISHSELTSLDGLETLTYLQKINVSHVRGTQYLRIKKMHDLNWSILARLTHLKKIVAVSTDVFRYLPRLQSLRLLENINLSHCVYYILAKNRKFEKCMGVIDLHHLRLFHSLKVVILANSRIADTNPYLPLLGVRLVEAIPSDTNSLELMRAEIALSNRLQNKSNKWD